MNKFHPLVEPKKVEGGEPALGRELLSSVPKGNSNTNVHPP